MSPPHHRTLPHGFWPAVSILAAVMLSLWAGCTVTKENYRVLSFFFDGVPDPSVAPGARPGEPGAAPVSVVMHKPYADERCDECHKTRYKPSRNQGGICLQCHGEVQTAYPRMHGPVSAAACLWCHNPHESAYPHLLRDADRKVCSQCHSGAMLDTTRVTAHADAGRGCLECHVAHGGSSPGLLRPGAGADTPPPDRK